MNHAAKIERMREIFDECLKVADAKGRDYSGTVDGMGNLRDFGTMGIVVRLGDKYYRAKNIIKSGKVHVRDESLIDTLRDMINYAALAEIMAEEEDEQIC